MKNTLALVALGTSILASAGEPCKTGCKTTILLQKPNGHPISGARIAFKLSCGDKSTVSETTDTQGEAVFMHSVDDLNVMQIYLQGFFSESISKPGCTGPDNDKRCIVKLGT